MSYRNFFPVFLFIFLATTLGNFSAEALQKSPNGRAVFAKKQTQEIKIQLIKLERDIRIYPEKVLRNPSSKPNIQRQKVRFLSRLRNIHDQINKFNNPKSHILLQKVHLLRQDIRKLEKEVTKLTLRQASQEQRKQRHSKPIPPCDLILSTISGSVVDADTSAPIPNREVDIYDSSGDWVSYGYTDGTGHYSVGGLTDGTYYARTYGYDTYIDELYDDIICEPYCNPTTGTPIILSGSATVDFALELGGSISGTITDSSTSAPIPDVYIQIYNSNGSSVAYGYSDSSGNYTVTGPLAGDYYATTYNYDNYIDEVYDDHPCEPDCNPLSGDPITVTAGQNTSAIDFALSPGGIISGTITDSATSNPIDSYVYVYDSSGNYISSGFTDGSGNYQVGGLLTGNYFVLTSNTAGYIDELFDNIPCYQGNCGPTSGDPVSVIEGSTTPGIDFALDIGGSFSGQVSGDGIPLPYSSVNVFDSEGFYIAYGYADESGNYSVTGLLDGNYYATTYNYYGFVNELYDDFPCQKGCDTTQGTPISVTIGSNTPGIDFDLDQGGTISGKVTDETTSDPIYSGVLIYDTQGILTDYAYTDGTGNYTSYNGLASGKYYAITYNYYGYMEELYDNIPCAFGKCDPLSGTPINVTTGNTTPNVDFELNQGGKISGNVSPTVGPPIPYFEVRIFNSTGSFLGYGYSVDSSGNYEVSGLPT
ncbi:carboxypeptidase regulatory-like domain-containing protein, partial [bacterium]|nr:carboxypeptidase regulatory-like domain-containing protein [bacterium]